MSQNATFIYKIKTRFLCCLFSHSRVSGPQTFHKLNTTNYTKSSILIFCKCFHKHLMRMSDTWCFGWMIRTACIYNHKCTKTSNPIANTYDTHTHTYGAEFKLSNINMWRTPLYSIDSVWVGPLNSVLLLSKYETRHAPHIVCIYIYMYMNMVGLSMNMYIWEFVRFTWKYASYRSFGGH